MATDSTIPGMEENSVNYFSIHPVMHTARSLALDLKVIGGRVERQQEVSDLEHLSRHLGNRQQRM